jgi:allantoate deiminase
MAAEAAALVMQRCAQLARITDRPGEILRTFLSPAMDEVHRTMRPWMEAAGMQVFVDRAGNLRGLYSPERDDKLPRLLLGSHLDTVRNAGAYDGVLGVMMGLALVELQGGCRLPFAIELIGFSDEEGTRFGAPFLGSRAVTGELSGSLLDRTDDEGCSVRQALEAFSVQRPHAIDAALSPHSAAWLEFHIEQGPVLETRNLALAAVEELAGQSRGNVVFRGNAGHAGTVPMKMRRDALAACAEWITRTERTAARFEGLMATVGELDVQPGGVNVIPGIVRCSLDVRHAADSVREAALQTIFDEATEIGKRRGVAVEATQYHAHPAVQFDKSLVNLAARAIADAGYEPLRMTGGAGHDAMILAPHLPAAMIFLRNPGGISHHPDESVGEVDVAAGLHAGLRFLEAFPSWLARNEDRISE